MRFADTVVFVKKGKATYNSQTGNYDEALETEESRFAHISDMSAEYQHLAFGGLRKGALTIRVKTSPTMDFDYIRVVGGAYKSDKKYRDIDRRKLRWKTTFQVEELQ